MIEAERVRRVEAMMRGADRHPGPLWRRPLPQGMAFVVAVQLAVSNVLPLPWALIGGLVLACITALVTLVREHSSYHQG